MSSPAGFLCQPGYKNNSHTRLSHTAHHNHIDRCWLYLPGWQSHKGQPDQSIAHTYTHPTLSHAGHWWKWINKVKISVTKFTDIIPFHFLLPFHQSSMATAIMHMLHDTLLTSSCFSLPSLFTPFSSLGFFWSSALSSSSGFRCWPKNALF